MTFAAAFRVVALAINVRRFFYGLALGTAILLGFHFAGAWGMRALLSGIDCHGTSSSSLKVEWIYGVALLPTK
jgi:hypothetical protein